MRKLIEATFVSLDGVIESPERWALHLWGAEHRVHATLEANDRRRAPRFVLTGAAYDNYLAIHLAHHCQADESFAFTITTGLHGSYRRPQPCLPARDRHGSNRRLSPCKPRQCMKTQEYHAGRMEGSA